MGLEVVDLAGDQALGFFGLGAGANGVCFENLDVRADVVVNIDREGWWWPGSEVSSRESLSMYRFCILGT